MHSPMSIARRVQVNALVALAVLTLVACGSDSSTSPTSPTSPATPTSPPATNLAGSWAGKASVYWDETDGGGGCSGPVIATFAQSGSTVSATLGELPGCLNEALKFEGTLAGDVLQGKMVFPTFTWHTIGQVSEDHVTMAATNVVWDLRR